ncbi:MAG: RtcB family protein [bacterium]|nr:RtcB family protein [bacterium]
MFECKNITDPEIRKKLDVIEKIESLEGAPLCLPNIHPKKNLESPPQFVAATRDKVIPMLSAPAMNCGMSLFATTLTEKDFSPEFLTMFAKNLRSKIPARVTRFESILGWLGIKSRAKQPYDLTKKQLEDIFQRGAEAAVEIYDLPKNELTKIEYGGRVGYEMCPLNTIVPRSSYSNGRHEMGYNFGGNHFLEIQVIEKIEDEEKAKDWNIKKGQLVMLYHGGGGHATYHLGRYFARREKNSTFEKFALFWLKLLFHFTSIDGIRNFHDRWRMYMSKELFPSISISTVEGRRLMNSIKIALNYGYAFRVALLRRIKDSLPKGDASFLWDAAHNSILEENGLVVHRQDAMRVLPGEPVMIAGSNNALSYLGCGLDTADKSLWSATPSAAKTIAGHPSRPDAGHETLVSRRKNKELTRIPHQTSEGLFEVTQKLEKAEIIKPVAYMRPLGGLKGH